MCVNLKLPVTVDLPFGGSVFLHNDLFFNIVSVILRWFVEERVLLKATKGELIEEMQVESRPEKVSNAVLDKHVDIYSVRNCFTSDA